MYFTRYDYYENGEKAGAVQLRLKLVFFAVDVRKNVPLKEQRS